MRCLCPMCSPTPSPTWTPQYRLECEARWLLGRPLSARQEYLGKIDPGRAETLKAEMLRLHRAGRAGGDA